MNVDHLGFGLIVRPIAAGSAEWNSKAGQEAIWTEINEHTKRGTWDLSGVRELDDVYAESRRTGEVFIIGGTHPILGAKGSERKSNDDEDLDLSCRTVFTNPSARSTSGLDVHALYDEISAAPITFQGSRVIRASATFMVFTLSSRDAKSAYLQSHLRREGLHLSVCLVPSGRRNGSKKVIVGQSSH